ncbi:copper resistance protein CopC [Frankia sp. Mgl5]|uniref:copper resistance CopC family protein n=1 Tax=Frankia sp. Mgl5 TaxID=2933793 RepID=UPI00200F576C|nr:copper resistance CopC family protein [Frankia sp. Mgl5]MCK9931350.1 copper resistance protein CopC [Frankia sp. Mgl5]
MKTGRTTRPTSRHRFRRLCRFAVLLLAAAAALVGQAGVASAHATLESSIPADGATVDDAPSEVRLVFSAAPLSVLSVTVTAPDGSIMSTGDPVQDGAEVFQALGPFTATGDYGLHYSVISEDSHAVGASLRFTFTGTPAAVPATSAGNEPEEGSDDGRGVGGVVLGAGIVLAVLVFGVLRLRRRD